MNVTEVRKNILESDEFVLSEFWKIQELFKMKRVIRYHHTREEVIDTESVAEHVYGMTVLINYFLPLEDQQGTWDYQTIAKTACYHDMDEIITGDRIGYLKTVSDREKEFIAQQEVITKVPVVMQEEITALMKAYDEQSTVEARFVKAIDKMEVIFHLVNENGKEILQKNKTTYAQHASVKDKYVAEFPYLKRLNEVLGQYMIENNFFYAVE